MHKILYEYPESVINKDYGLKPNRYCRYITTGLSPWLLIIKTIRTLVLNIKDLKCYIKQTLLEYYKIIIHSRYSLNINLINRYPFNIPKLSVINHILINRKKDTIHN
jgi:hypothetical protein